MGTQSPAARKRSAGSKAALGERDDAKDRQFVTALARGLDILRCFSPSKLELGTSEIAKMIDLPQPTVWRLCHTLVESGYLMWSSPNRKLRLGAPVLALGYAAIASQPIAEIARPLMQALADRINGAVSLSTRDGLNMIMLQRCVGSSIVLADLRVGSSIPIATTATGWAYLAGLTPEARDDVIGEIRGGDEMLWGEVARRFSTALKRYADDLYVVNKGTLHQHINAVAVPVRFPGGSPLLSLNAAGLSAIFTDEKLRATGRSLLELAASLESGKSPP